MKKSETVLDDDMLPEYDFRAGVRGKYAHDFGRNRNLRVLAPDLLSTFPDSDSVNETLRTLVRIAGASTAVPVKRSTVPKSKRKPRG